MGQCMSSGTAGRRVGASGVVASASSSSISSVSSLHSVSSETSQNSKARRLSIILASKKDRKRALAKEKKEQKLMKCRESRLLKIRTELRSEPVKDSAKNLGASPSLPCSATKKSQSGKSVTFSEPENQADAEVEPEVIATHTGRKPLSSINSEIRSKSVSKLKVFKFLTKRNVSGCEDNAGAATACENVANKTGSNLTTEEDTRDRNNKVTNGNFESSVVVTSPEFPNKCFEDSRMGVDCKDGNGNFAMLVERAGIHVAPQSELDYVNGAKLITETLNLKNNNTSWPVSGSNLNDSDNSNYTESLRKAELIRDRIRKQRDLFFGSSPSPSPVPERIESSTDSDMKGLRTLENGYHDRRFTNGNNSNGICRTYALSNHGPEKQVKDGVIPKLFSVPNGSQCDSLSPPKQASKLPIGPSSRLPMFSCTNGSSHKNLRKTVSVGSTNGGKLQPYALRTGKVTRDTNTNTDWVSGNDFFQPKANFQNSKTFTRRETLPSRFSAGADNKNSVNPNAVTNPTRRSSGGLPLGSRLPTYNATVRKPMESEPFYMLGLYQNRPTQAINTATYKVNKTALTSYPFPTVSTGNVKEKMQQYQDKISEKNETNAGNHALNRSATFTKTRACMPQTLNNVGEIPPLIDSKTESSGSDDNASLPGMMEVNKGHIRMTNVRSNTNFRIRAFNRPGTAGCPVNLTVRSTDHSNSSDPCNYPITRDDSTASSVASSEGRYVSTSHHSAADPDKAISDSEFLIDDEISDQPELTLTFKDSPLILSPSSSGESLISCDLMLDYKDGNCSGHMSSDSTLLEEEPSVIVTSRDDKFCRVAEETVPQQVVEDKTDNSSRNTVNASPQKTMVRNTEAGESQVGAVIATTPVTNKTPKGSPNHVATTSPNLVNVNSIRQPPLHQASNISPPRSYNKLQYSSPAHTPEANHNHSTPKRSNDEVRSRSHPPSVRQTNITRSPCRIPQNRNGQTQIPRTPSPIMPPSRCLKPRSQEIAYPNKLLAENRNRINTNDTQMNNFVQEVLADVTEYKLQLQQLIEVLTDVEKDCGEKDEIIRQQQKEIEFWRNKAVALESNISANVNLTSPSRRPMRSANQNESAGVAMDAGKTNSEESSMR